MRDAQTSRSPGRWLPATWKGGLALAVPWILLVWVRWADPLGDRGSLNVFTYLLVLLGLFFWMVWLLSASGQPWKRRLAGFLLPIFLLGGFFAVFRIERMSGEMIPTFALRTTPEADEGLEVVDETAGGVDLVTETPDDFPEFLGPGRRLALDHVRIDPDWQAQPPELLWRRPIGAGWSGFAVRNGYALTMEQRGDQELVSCYRVETGEPCWTWATPAGSFRSTIAGDGPRATPAIHDGRVYSVGVYGKVAALDGATGEPLWQRDLNRELGIADRHSEIFPYGRSNSPLVTGDLLVVPYGGSPEDGYVSLLAMDRHSGETVWQGGDHQIACASPVTATLNGRRQILSVDSGRVAGYAPETGEVLWSRPWPGRVEADCNVSDPVPVGSDRVFVSKGYGQGAALLQIETANSGFSVRELWHYPRVLRTKLTNVVVHDGYVYGLSDGILECVELATGERAWKRGRYHHGQILRVSEHLLVLTEDGEIVLVEATPERANQVLGRFQALDGKTWNNFALSGDVLLVRNGREAAAYRLPLLP